MKKFFSFLMIGTLLIVAGCSKDDKDNDSNPTGPTVTEDAPAFKIHTVELPDNMKQSSDQHAQTVVLYTNMANLFGTTLNGYFVPPSLNKVSGDGPWQHVWQDGELNVIVLIKKLTDRYTWEVSYDGTDGEHVYQNFIAFRAEQAIDERSGAFYMYMPNTELIFGQYTWSVDDNGTLHFEVVADAYLQGSKFVGMVNEDRSGTLEIINTLSGTDVLQEKYQWDNNGAGEWWEYDADGNLVDSGMWE